MDTHINCPQCGKSCHKFGLRNHIRYSHEGAPINHCAAGWNRGLTKGTDDRVKKNALSVAAAAKRFMSTLTSEEKKSKYGGPKRWSPNTGGIRAGSGRGKKGWYKGYWCDSSWELAWVIYNLDHGVSFTRNREGFSYSYANKTFKFYPDFKVMDGYVEVKGWVDEKTRAKLSQFSGKLTVIDKAGMKPYLEYAVNQHGKDFIKLYGGESGNRTRL